MKILIACLTLALLAGCTTISPATVDLSMEITSRIKTIETSHVNAVNIYFDSEVQRIDKFMKEKWIPLFLRNFVGISMILEDLKKTETIGANTKNNLTIAAKGYLDDPAEAEVLTDKVIDLLNQKRKNDDVAIKDILKSYIPNDKVDVASIHLMAILNIETPAVLIMEFSASANDTIQKQRQSLLLPLTYARQKAIEEIRMAYMDIYAGQGVITGRLEAAVNRNRHQDRLVDAIAGEGTAADINSKMAKLTIGINSAFEKVNKVTAKIEAYDNSGDDLIAKLKTGIQDAVDKAGLGN